VREAYKQKLNSNETHKKKKNYIILDEFVFALKGEYNIYKTGQFKSYENKSYLVFLFKKVFHTLYVS